MVRWVRLVAFGALVLAMICLGVGVGLFLVANSSWVPVEVPPWLWRLVDASGLDVWLPGLLAGWVVAALAAVTLTAWSFFYLWRRRQYEAMIQRLERELAHLRNLPFTQPAPLEDLPEDGDGDGEGGRKALMATLALVLLVAVAALAGGMLIGRYYVPDDRAQKRAAGHSQAYMRALNSLLGRDHDAAVAELRQVVRDDVADVEPYFALGALFRARGEHERAIRVHQAIELREDENPRIALRARYELGLDFRAAGMPRRATRAMEDCLAEDPEHEGALRALCGLYEEQQRYTEAALAWERLERRGDIDGRRVLHLWSAAAAQAACAGDADLAERALSAARARDGDHPHALAAAAEVAVAGGDSESARELWVQALARAPALSSYLAARLYEVELDAAAGTRPEEGKLPAGDKDVAESAARRTAAELEKVGDSVGGEPHLLFARAELTARFDPEAAREIYKEAALRSADFLPARVATARLALASGDAEAIEEELTALAGERGALDWALEATWRCGQCAARAPAYFWRCASCRQWGKARREVGRAAFDPVPEAPRERRASGRKSARPLLDQSGAISTGEGGDENDSLLDRASSIITGVWRTVRREGPGSRSDADD